MLTEDPSTSGKDKVTKNLWEEVSSRDCKKRKAGQSQVFSKGFGTWVKGFVQPGMPFLLQGQPRLPWKRIWSHELTYRLGGHK